MAQHGQQYGRQTDEFGNPIRQTEEYGGTNMGQQHGTTGGDAVVYGGEQIKTTGGGAGMGAGGGGGGMGTGLQHNTGMQHNEHQGQGILHRTGSGSSSSSEDDGEGGRRKKGLKEKLKENLPGGHNKGQDQEQIQGTTTTGYGTEGQDEKKGLMEKIKEKLPGGHN